MYKNVVFASYNVLYDLYNGNERVVKPGHLVLPVSRGESISDILDKVIAKATEAHDSRNMEEVVVTNLNVLPSKIRWSLLRQ